MKFLTYKTELQQLEEDKKWYTLHNQLFLDEDDSILLVPRYFITDGYTIPPMFALIAGNRMEIDIRPAVEHDIECKYRKIIKVNLTIDELRSKGLLRHHLKEETNELIPVCEDIPLEFLTFEDVEFKEATKRMRRMMSSIKSISKYKMNIISSAVWLNVGWLIDKPEILIKENIYKTII